MSGVDALTGSSHTFLIVPSASRLALFSLRLESLKFGVPQSSVLGPIILFSLYTTPLSKVISKHPDVKFHLYADDAQLFIHLIHKNAEIAFDRLGKCLEDVKLWLCANKLKLNADKTDFIIFGSKSQQKKLNPFFPVNILGESLIPSDAVKNLGVWFDSDFSFTKHVKNVCKLCFIQMRDLRQIRQYLTRDAALMAVANLRKLQRIQNSLARTVCRASCLSHTTPLRKALHWLPIRHRCIFKTALLVYKYLHTNCPKYFSPFLKVRQCAYNTRLSQSDGIILHVPQYQPSIYTSTKQFSLSFAYDAPKIWNELPDDVRSATSIASFRKKLKAYLFSQAYPQYFPPHMAFSVMSTIAMDKDYDFCDYTYDVAP